MPLPVANGNEAQLPVWQWREVLRALPQVERNTVALVALIAPVTSAPGDPNRRVRIRLDATQLETVKRAYALVER